MTNENQCKQSEWCRTNPVIVFSAFTVAVVVVFSASDISSIVCWPIGLIRPVVFALVPVTVISHCCQKERR